MTEESTEWQKVLEPDELPEGRVKTATYGHLTLCMTHFEGQYGALDNRCPLKEARWGRGQSKTACFAVPGMAGTTIPLLERRQASTTKASPFPSTFVRMASM